MHETIKNRLDLCNNLPSLPGAATRIIELARDPRAGMDQVADAVKLDPALAAKLLRVANSPLYARRRRCESFQQALVLLGLNATLTLALTFSLVSSLRTERSAGLDYARVWRRALIAATAARVIGERLGVKGPEELFLAGLLQDIGMLALDRGYAELYSALGDHEQAHDKIVELELSHLKCDHAEVGAWLLERWHLPDRLRNAVAASHKLATGDRGDGQLPFLQAVSLSGKVADVFLDESPEAPLAAVHDLADRVSALDSDTLAQLLDEVAQAVPEIETLFDMELLDPKRSEWILHEAREVIVFRNLQMVQESAQLREVAESLQAQANALEEKSRRDDLTGAYNRGHLDNVLANWFADPNKEGVAMTLAFVDLDNFKKVNDLFGHHCGDRVLVKAAELLHALARGSDVVTRYGGEEFVLVLPGCGADGARRFCERLLQAFRGTMHDVDHGKKLRVTVSIGIATHGERKHFRSYEEMMRSADAALYRAKQAGKDRFVEDTETADAA